MASYKTITFAIVHMLVAFGVVYLLTGSIVIGSAVALIEPAVNTVAYFFHEKVWERWLGRRSSPKTSPGADSMTASSNEPSGEDHCRAMPLPNPLGAQGRG